MNSGEDTASPKTQVNNTQDVTAPSDMDLKAINQAIAESANEAVQEQNSFDVKDISLDNTPTSDAELKAQMDKDPNMSLAGANSKPAAAPTAIPSEKPSETAGFVDGDLEDEPSEKTKPPVDDKDYSKRAADPVDSFENNSPAMPTDVSETTPKDNEEKEDSDTKDEESSNKDGDKDKDKKEKKSSKNSIDFGAVVRNNSAIVVIVAVVIVIIMGIVLAVSLNS